MTASEYQIIAGNIDLEQLVALRLEALRTDPDSFGEKLEYSSRRSASEWARWYAERDSGNNTLFVIAREGSYLGMCGLMVNETEKSKSFIWGVYIRPKYRGQGLARQLLATAIDCAKDKGLPGLTIRIEATNLKAVGLYSSLGFSTLTSQSDYTEMALNLQVMRSLQ